MNVAVLRKTEVARPLKTLIPLIQGELQQGNTAGREHFTQAGRLLNEAKEQVPHGRWGTWLTNNFDLSRRTAQDYMRWARERDQKRTGGAQVSSSLREMRGGTEREREHRGSKQQQAFRRVLRDVASEAFVQDRQAKEDEVKLHRDLAEELVDIGYRALATKLHPDRGGSQIAMTRLNRVRDELKAIAQQRRFI